MYITLHGWQQESPRLESEQKFLLLLFVFFHLTKLIGGPTCWLYSFCLFNAEMYYLR